MARGRRVTWIREQARDALLLAGVTRPDQIDPVRIALALDVEVTYGGITGATERISMIDGRARLRIADGSVHEGRKAFTCAHALGHTVCGHVVPTDRDVAGWVEYACGGDSSDDEDEADDYAVELLAPEPWARPYCSVATIDFDAVRTIERVFPVSPVMATMRLVELTHHACAVVYSERGFVKWSKANRAFRSWIPRGFALPDGSIARDFFDSRAISSAPRSIAAGSWLPTSQSIEAHIEIVEHAQLVPAPGWDGVLSLLWIPDLGSVPRQRAHAE